MITPISLTKWRDLDRIPIDCRNAELIDRLALHTKDRIDAERVANVLHRARQEIGDRSTVAEMCLLSKSQMLRVRGIGVGTLAILAEAFDMDTWR